MAVVNREFAKKVFGPSGNAVGRYFKQADGTRTEILGIVEDGKYHSLTEDTGAGDLPAIRRSRRR